VAELLALPVELIRARARLSFFAGAVLEDDGTWRIPDRALKVALLGTVEPHKSVKEWALLLGVSYSKLIRVTHQVVDLKDPLPVGKLIRARLLFLPDTKPMMRIPESEIKRWLGGVAA
jgi:hypothetical protein